MRIFLTILLLLLTYQKEYGSIIKQHTCLASYNTNVIEVEEKKEQKHIGIDVSKYQDNIKWDNLDASVKFVIFKATEGTDLVDRKFKHNWDKSGSDVYKGAYHFFRPLKSGKQQAKLFLKTTNLKSGDIIPVLDVEYTKQYKRMSKKNKALMARNLNEYISVIESSLGVKPIIYTSASFWNDYIRPSYKKDVSDHILWVADYRKRKSPAIPKGWNDWHIWQHTDKGKVRGISKRVDMNICKHDLGTLVIN